MKRPMFPPAILVGAALISALVPPAARGQDDESRFHARLADGTVVAGETIRDWHDVNATPRVGNYALFDPKRPAEWLVRDAPPNDAPPAAFVEFVGGDRLPGEVVGYSTGAETRYRRLPPHFIVQPAAAFRRPNTEHDPPLRIESQHVRRVVWHQSTGEPVPPNTAVLRDGRRVAFRAVRWGATEVTLLLDDGVESISFADLAELSLPSGDTWQAYFNHASLLPGGDGRLIQLETSDGLIALVSPLRLRAEAHGDNRRQEHWYQAIQPAWSLDPFWVPFASIDVWRFFSPDRVPVTLLDPHVTRTGVVFSAARPPLANRAVTGGMLTDGKTLFGWGFGTHAPCELWFPLPRAAVAFHGGFALDPSVGPGGCAKARIELRASTADGSRLAATEGSATPPTILHQSDLLIGTSAVKNTGRLAFPAASEDPRHARELVLISDPAHDERPTAADPFDVRDAFNWLAPQVELDPTFVKAELRRRAVSGLPGLAGWEVTPETAVLATVTNRWDTRDWEDPRFRSVLSVESAFLSMSRRLRIGDDDRYLAVYAHCPHDEFRPARIQVRIDGIVLAELPVPIEHGRREPDPLLFPVTQYAGQTVSAEIVQLPGAINESKPAAVDWRGAELVPHHPGLRSLFEDDPAFAASLTQAGGSVAVETSEHHSGTASLTVTPPGMRSDHIDGWRFPIAEEPDLGEYRFLRFAWKAAGRGPVAFHAAHDGRFGAVEGIVEPPRRIRHRPSRSDDRGLRNGYRYVAGPDAKDDSDFSPTIRIDGKPPEDWQVVQRDLYGDFGAFTLTGFGVTNRDGPLNLDGIYLARHGDDFRLLGEQLAGPPQPHAGEGELLLATNDPRTFGPLVSVAAPGFGLIGQGGELQLLREHRGHANVLRTHPEGGDEKQSARLTAAIVLPQGKPRLTFSVAQHGTNDSDQKDWDLQVFAGGRELLTRRVDRNATSGGWLDVTADLSDFAGRPTRVELRHKATGWDQEFAYWRDVRIVTQ